jgi:hypothetical protein
MLDRILCIDDIITLMLCKSNHKGLFFLKEITTAQNGEKSAAIF